MIKATTAFLLAGFASGLNAAIVTLQQATATYSEDPTGQYSPANSIDGIVAVNAGWSIVDRDTGTSLPQTAVFETATDAGFAGGSIITFMLRFDNPPQFHSIGRFRLSLTTDDRSMFADGLNTGGDVTASWVMLDTSAASTNSGVTLTELGDLSLLASGSTPDAVIYTVTAPTTLTGITGVRLEVLSDPSLPTSGPGRNPANGDFTLTEFQMDIVPEPASAVLLLSGAALCLGRRRIRNANETLNRAPKQPSLKVVQNQQQTPSCTLAGSADCSAVRCHP